MNIQLQPLKLKHASRIFQLIQDSRDILDPWLPSIRKLGTQDSLEYFLLSRMYQYDYPKICVFEIWYQKKISGLIYVHSGDEETRSVELSYWLGKMYVGKGIMTEACELLLHRLFDTTTVEHVDIRCHPANIKSQGIPKRLGFEGAAEADNPDFLRYTLTKNRWFKKHPYSFLYAIYPQVI